LHEFTFQSEYKPNEKVIQLVESKNIQETDSILDRIRIHLLPCDLTLTLKKRQFQDYFDVVYVSNAMAHRVGDLNRLMTHGGAMVAETANFMIELTKPQTEAFTQKMLELGKEAGLWSQNSSGNNLILRCRREE